MHYGLNPMTGAILLILVGNTNMRAIVSNFRQRLRKMSPVHAQNLQNPAVKLIFSAVSPPLNVQDHWPFTKPAIL